MKPESFPCLDLTHLRWTRSKSKLSCCEVRRAQTAMLWSVTECSPPRNHQCPPPPGFSKPFPAFWFHWGFLLQELQPHTSLKHSHVCLFSVQSKHFILCCSFLCDGFYIASGQTAVLSSLFGGKQSFSSPSHLINNIIARIISRLIDWLKVISAIK